MTDNEETERTVLLTIGHGTISSEELTALLHDAGVEVLLDVRSYPGSRRNPQFGREQMEQWVPEAGIEYRWDRRLGGRRRPRPDSPHVGLRHEAFRAYADHMETDEFHEGLDALMDMAAKKRTAIMCSESVWWRCHRRLIADAAIVLRDADVEHIFHDHRLRPHAVTAGARRDTGDDDRIVYEAVDD